MTTTSRMSSHIRCYIIMMYSRHSKIDKKMIRRNKKRNQKKKENKKRDRDSKKFRIRYYHRWDNRKKKKRQGIKWRTCTLTSTRLLKLTITSIKIKNSSMISTCVMLPNYKKTCSINLMKNPMSQVKSNQQMLVLKAVSMKTEKTKWVQKNPQLSKTRTIRVLMKTRSRKRWLTYTLATMSSSLSIWASSMEIKHLKRDSQSSLSIRIWYIVKRGKRN